MERLRRHEIAASLCLAAIFAAPPAQVNIELPGAFGEFRLVNRGPAVRLNSVVKVQRKVDGAWQDAPVANLYLIQSCAPAAPPECVELAAGARLKPVPWTGNSCSSQCVQNCNLDGALPAGAYRFLVTTCDRKRRFVSPQFEKK